MAGRVRGDRVPDRPAGVAMVRTATRGRTFRSRAGRAGLALLPVLVLTGCGGGAAPLLIIFGAFFPAWIFCAVLGLLGGAVLRLVLGRLGVHAYIRLPGLFYAACMVLLGVSVWLAWYGGSAA
ncbi:hypothetical protein HLH34_01535 [Gluconacetobacter azotocaptans]|uniref:Uncharacterized protein YtcA n=1 Tax=Gluconacetobacter azotocaptans TaxID=142834 RepID=A0A7W4JPQ6_9PROT|nr:YtcA family lipoprotein [Gluconacetobacter azotocaptans]MBB2188646.1 hypothetical protein [Gluconacetobacter azotocaptans]MBM9400408.1 hypothetical protein [Gluconacetobacter azotocaptans]GBQ35236.1 hypothetical protein AA13594_3068 [Gluconacetobacter azotocaptans DSM 13594]